MQPMRVLVTGGAGFVGSNLVDRLLTDGHEVVAFDNLSTGQTEFLSEASRARGFTLVEGDTLDQNALIAAMKGVDLVFHLAAHADVREGTTHPCRDLQQNTMATSTVLEAMRKTGVKKIAFASSGAIYGDASVHPTPEDAPFPVQTSLYGASKLAAEGLIAAYSEAFGIQGYVFRFVSLLGDRYSHGHIFDFYKSLQRNPNELVVLGNGRQRKSYLHVDDCIDAMLTALEQSHAPINIFNLGTDEYCEVNDSIAWITEYLKLAPRLRYSGGDRGWVGDSPFIFLDCHRMRELGWRPRYAIRDAVIRTVEYLDSNQWLFERRP